MMDSEQSQKAEIKPIEASSLLPSAAEHVTPPEPLLYRLRWLREIVEMAFAILVIYTLVNLLSMRYIVHGRSMDPTFGEGQFLIVSRVHYWFEEPSRGDIVVFHAPNDPSEDYIKRVIGAPGDHIEFQASNLHVNGSRIEEPYIAETCSPFSCIDGASWIVPPGSYFVLGDNRNSSVDSRRAQVGFIERKMIVGKVLFRYWPLTEMTLIDRGVLPTP